MIWIIGAGGIAAEYDKVLTSLGTEFITIGRGEDSAKKYEGQTGHSVIRGGLELFVTSNPELPEGAIVAVPTTQLASTCTELMNYGVRRIFCEKPGFCKPEELESVLDCAQDVVTGRVNRIRSGETAPLPLQDGLQSPCSWCDHADACLYDSTLPGCKIRELDHKHRMEMPERKS